MKTLTSSPNDLPYLKRGTVLTTPIDISVAMPIGEVKFYQSKEFIGSIFYVIYCLLVMLWFITIFLLQNVGIFIGGFLIVFVFLNLNIKYKEFEANKESDNISKFFYGEFTWQTKSIFVLNHEDVQFGEYFDDDSQDINYKVIDNFQALYRDTIGINYRASYVYDSNPQPRHLNECKDSEKYKWLTSSFSIKHRFILVNSEYRIKIKDLIRLINKLKDDENDEVVYRKTSL